MTELDRRPKATSPVFFGSSPQEQNRPRAELGRRWERSGGSVRPGAIPCPPRAQRIPQANSAAIRATAVSACQAKSGRLRVNGLSRVGDAIVAQDAVVDRTGGPRRGLGRVADHREGPQAAAFLSLASWPFTRMPSR